MSTNTKYRDSFVKNLTEDCKYPIEEIHHNTYKYGGKEYWRIEVFSEGRIIQAFVLMSKTHCERLDKHKFPFYRTYAQWNDYGYLTPPACNVAVFNEETEKWEIHSASDLKHEITSPSFLNYKEAVKRFNKRWEFSGNRKFQKRFICLSIICILIVALYIAAYILSVNELLAGVEIPLNAAVVSVLVVVVLLLLIPPLIPYLKSITVKGFGLEFNEVNPD
ncbi:MAG: hypothetical protein K6E61_00130 [Bacteroidales bacterium]|nr:hypothetical protein [Bacteroidales bacterium]